MKGNLPKQILVLALMLFLILSACAMQQTSPPQLEPESAGRNPGKKVPQPEDTLPPRSMREAVLIAVGDIMMHQPQTRSGYDPKTKRYQFDGFFTEVKGILGGGDWVIGNLETPLAGKEAGFSGYPRFNAPEELADALKNAGFTILTTANNHTLDRGEEGVIRTLENLRARNLYAVGTAASMEESEQILIVAKKGISMAFLAYTYGTNGIPIPEGKEYLVSLIDEERIKKEIARARRLGADVVTVMLHFGIEYQRQPNEEQIRLVRSLIGAGADIVLGSHPHVVQPYQFLEIPQEGGGVRKRVAIYSMGNFISNQRRPYTDLGVIFRVTVRKHFPDGEIEFSGVEAIPTWVHRYREEQRWQYRVLPLTDDGKYRDDLHLTGKEKEALALYRSQMMKHLQSLAVPVQEMRP